ncbi:MAG: alpha/beta fold hydrolase [Elusimicrobia bacterium]|nr:alpha/beta fold hydrolase [Elusimicrobiota bacterium]
MAACARDGVELYYEVRGRGEPLLLIAGLASDSQSWLPVLAGLSQRFQVVALDNRGSGRTKPPDAPLSIRAMAEDCAAVLSSLGLGPAHVLGHSMGGFIAQDLAARHPGLVRRLVLAGTSSSSSPRNNALFQAWADSLGAGPAPESWWRGLFAWIFSPRFFADPAAVRAAVRASVEYPYLQSPAAFRGQVRAIAEFDGSAGLSRIQAQTMVLSGAEDLLFPPEAGAELARRIFGARASSISGAGHAMHVERPEAFISMVSDFLLGRAS